MVKAFEGKGNGRTSEISRVTPWLYLSGARAVRQSNVTQLGVTCIVNATAELPELPLEGVELLTARVSDSDTASFRPFLHHIADKLRQVRDSGGRALVHCVAGVSRSPSIVLAFLVKHEGLSLRDAFIQVRQVRPIIRPNTNFFRQLVEFEEEVRGASSVAFVPLPESNLTIPDVCEDELSMANSKLWSEMVKARRNLSNHFA